MHVQILSYYLETVVPNVQMDLPIGKEVSKGYSDGNGVS